VRLLACSSEREISAAAAQALAAPLLAVVGLHDYCFTHTQLTAQGQRPLQRHPAKLDRQAGQRAIRGLRAEYRRAVLIAALIRLPASMPWRCGPAMPNARVAAQAQAALQLQAAGDSLQSISNQRLIGVSASAVTG